jgi:hypothetical protein
LSVDKSWSGIEFLPWNGKDIKKVTNNASHNFDKFAAMFKQLNRYKVPAGTKTPAP